MLLIPPEHQRDGQNREIQTAEAGLCVHWWETELREELAPLGKRNILGKGHRLLQLALIAS